MGGLRAQLYGAEYANAWRPQDLTTSAKSMDLGLRGSNHTCMAVLCMLSLPHLEVLKRETKKVTEVSLVPRASCQGALCLFETQYSGLPGWSWREARAGGGAGAH